MSINNKLIVIFAGLTTIATVVYSVFAGWQLYEIHSGAKDTHDLAVAAGKQADKMKDMSDAADKIRQAAEGMVTQEQRVADNAKNALDASNRQSKAALDASIANSRLDQRPWVSVSEFALSSEPDTQQPFSEDVLLQNTGKTPALDELCQAQPLIWRLQPPNTPTMIEYNESAPLDQGSHTVIAPGDRHISCNSNPWLPDPSLIADYKAKKATLYLHVNIRYRDIFGRPHWTKVCAWHTFGTPAQAFGYCNTGNAMDQEK